MRSSLFTAALALAAASGPALAAPADVPAVEKRQFDGLTSVLGDVTSAFGDVTSIGGSVFSRVTSAGQTGFDGGSNPAAKLSLSPTAWMSAVLVSGAALAGGAVVFA
ncbi:hypothetical protein DMC30DRAFT_415900 [Rhodotorula diobovata]|uniref:Secreted protein n=1 Tax=Rhodotorula diobovata TaxID=5288 RepID=A0A5C5FYC5_9BASI|nr:hypothetical protein DMC30DRAFT_415900 [Rhodotorula diobovata]